MKINSKTVKRTVLHMGSDLCGIAAASRFAGAPEGFRPADVYGECKSVVVFACRFPESTLRAGTQSPYTFVRNMLVGKLDGIAFRLSDDLDRNGVGAVPIPSAEPYDCWDSDRRRGMGILSLKHAAVLAGLGAMGKNTLLVTREFGNMVWLGAVLTSAELDPDPVSSFEACALSCTVCLDACPKNALDGVTLDQKLCREKSVSYTDGGGWVLSCNACRKVCPHRSGFSVRSNRGGKGQVP
jgi:epoxyqueuosine reductase